MQFVLVDDDGALLTYGQPVGQTLPPLRERQRNYLHVRDSKYGQNAFERPIPADDEGEVNRHDSGVKIRGNHTDSFVASEL